MKKRWMAGFLGIFLLCCIAFPGVQAAISFESGVLAADSIRSAVSREDNSVPYTLEYQWKTTADGKRFQYEGGDRTKLFITPQSNEVLTVSWNIRFQLDQSTVAGLPAGSVRFTVPAFLFENWNGEGDPSLVNVASNVEKPQMNWQIAEAPAQSPGVDFNYTDNGDGTYTVTNYREIPGGTIFNFDQSFTFMPSLVKTDANGLLQKNGMIQLDIDANQDGSSDVHEERTLAVSMQTSMKKGTLALDVSRKDHPAGAYLVWQDTWGERPSDDDGQTYFYVIWAADYQRGGGTTTPLTAQVSDMSESGNDSFGELVGNGYRTWHINTFRYRINTGYPRIADKKDPVAYRQLAAGVREGSGAQGGKYRLPDVQYPGSPGEYFGESRPCLSQFYLRRYPLSMLEGKSPKELETDGVDVSAAVEAEERTDTGYVEKLTAQKTANVTFVLREGTLNIYNRNQALTLNDGGRWLLTSGESSRLHGTWDARAYSWRTDSVTLCPKDQEQDGWNLALQAEAPYFVSGAKEELSSRSYKELVENGAKPLTDGDYTYHGFDLSFSEYRSEETYIGKEIGGRVDDIEQIQPVEVWIRSDGEKEFNKFAEVKWLKDEQGKDVLTVFDANGNVMEKKVHTILSTMYRFPERTAAVEYRHKSGQYAVDMQITTSVVLKPSGRLREMLQADIDNGRDSLVGTYVKRAVSGELTDDTSAAPMSRTAYQLGDMDPEAQVDMKSLAAEDDPEHALQKIQTSVYARNMAFDVVGGLTGAGENRSEVGADDLRIYRKFLLRTGTFYVLLPPGTYIDPSEVKLKYEYNWSYNQGRYIPEKDYTIDLIYNYEKSGQTMLVIDYDIPAEEVMRIDRLYSGPTVRADFVIYNAYHNILDRGRNTMGTVAFVNGTDPAVPYKRNEAQTTTQKLTYGSVYERLMADYPETILLTQRALNFNAVTAAQSGFSKTVSSDADKTYMLHTDVDATQGYTYRLVQTNEKDTRSDQIIFFDILEQGRQGGSSQWQGSLEKVDISVLANRLTEGSQTDKLNPIVYYALQLPTQSQMDLSDPIWTQEKPEDMSKIKAIAVDATKTVSGKDFILGPGQTLPVYIRMRAPSDQMLDGKQTVNEASVRVRSFADTQPAQGDAIQSMTAHAGVTLHVGEKSFTAVKSWDEEGPIQDREVRLQLFAQAKWTTGEQTRVGEPVTTQGQEYTWDHLPLYNQAGNKLTYTVEELDIPAHYEVSYSREIDDKITVKNIWRQSYVDISVSKRWIVPKDDPVTVTLLRDGELVEGQLLRLSSDNNWKDLFHKLPVYNPKTNEKYQYTVREENIPEGYAATVTGDAEDGFVITNTNIEKVTIPVTKIWIGPAAKQIKIRLMRDKKAVEGDAGLLKLTAADKATDAKDEVWKGAFKDLPAYDPKDGHAYVYAVSEEELPAGYELAEQVGNQKDGFTLTNRNIQTVDIPVEKKWIGPAGQEAQITLVRDGEAMEEKTLTLTGQNSWKDKFTDLPKYDPNDGHAYDYAVDETTVPEGYVKKSVEGNVDDGFTITNVNTQTRSISVKKVWRDPDETKRPAGVKIQLQRDGQETDQMLELTADGNWQGAFTDLLMYDPTDGHPYTYDIKEVDVPEAYRSVKTGIADNGFTVTNTITGKMSVGVTKKWIGPQAGPVEIRLLQNEQKVVHIGETTQEKTVTLSDENSWQSVFTGLDQYDPNGQPYTYEVEEISPVPDGYAEPVITGDMDKGFVVTNKNIETVDVPVTKKWIGPEGDLVEIQLLQNGQETVRTDEQTGPMTRTLSEGNGWTDSFTGLPKYDPDTGKPYDYDVQEVSVPAGYEMTKSGDVESGFTIVNTNVETVDVSVTKKWIGPAAGDVDVRLYQNGKPNVMIDGQETQQILTLSADHNWSDTFKKLPKYDPDSGQPYAYTVDEENVPAGYEKQPIEGDGDNGFVITNKNVETVSVPVAKKWKAPEDMPLPEEVQIVLIRDGQEMEQTLTLTVDKDWSGVFTDLPKYDPDTAAAYTYEIRETPVEGYVSEVTGSAGEGYTVTNTITGKVSVGVTKKWIGDAGKKAVIHLLADGKEIDTVKLTGKNGWQHTFADLEQYKDGEEILYTVTEDDVDGYTSAIEETAPHSFLVTNTQKAVPKEEPKPEEPKKPAAPQTGDHDGSLPGQRAVMMLAMAALLLAVAYAVSGLRRRTSRQKRGRDRRMMGE